MITEKEQKDIDKIVQELTEYDNVPLSDEEMLEIKICGNIFLTEKNKRSYNG